LLAIASLRGPLYYDGMHDVALFCNTHDFRALSGLNVTTFGKDGSVTAVLPLLALLFGVATDRAFLGGDDGDDASTTTTTDDDGSTPPLPPVDEKTKKKATTTKREENQYRKEKGRSRSIREGRIDSILGQNGR